MFFVRGMYRDLDPLCRLNQCRDICPIRDLMRLETDYYRNGCRSPSNNSAAVAECIIHLLFQYLRA